MTVYNEKRSCKRCGHEIPIWLTRFNTGNWSEAQALNHCTDGMRIQSNFLLRPGSTVLIRMKDIQSNGLRTSDSEGLPTIVLGNVKWCRENPDANQPPYDHGIKYFAPAY
ncbi:hypothetical protein ACFL03_01700 [Thermodesulfobacteriota bacterium]